MTNTTIIDNVIPTSRTRELVRIAIPTLVSWAVNKQTKMTYDNLNRALGYDKSSSYVGKLLGWIADVMDELENRTGEEIPTLNALCKKTSTGIPSDGFSYVYPNYDSLTLEEKKVFITGINDKAYNYKKWDWVLNELGLKPAKIFTTEELEKISTYGKGGEGAEHKAIKEFVYCNPFSVGIKDVKRKEAEYVLPSGDRLDAYFELSNGNRVAIEVKPSTSPDDDITRGIFQCVKYKAVLEAIRKVDYGKYDVSTLLAIADTMSEQNRLLAETLNIIYVERYNIEG